MINLFNKYIVLKSNKLNYIVRKMIEGKDLSKNLKELKDFKMR
jgi:hypothetical protein